jgi:hypothetical protein
VGVVSLPRSGHCTCLAPPSSLPHSPCLATHRAPHLATIAPTSPSAHLERLHHADALQHARLRSCSAGGGRGGGARPLAGRSAAPPGAERAKHLRGGGRCGGVWRCVAARAGVALRPLAPASLSSMPLSMPASVPVTAARTLGGRGGVARWCVCGGSAVCGGWGAEQIGGRPGFGVRPPRKGIHYPGTGRVSPPLNPLPSFTPSRPACPWRWSAPRPGVFRALGGLLTPKNPNPKSMNPGGGAHLGRTPLGLVGAPVVLYGAGERLRSRGTWGAGVRWRPYP